MPISTSRFVNHLIFWVGIFAFYSFSIADPDLYREYIEIAAFKLPLMIFAAYALNSWQVPSYLHQKRYLSFGISLVCVIVVLVFIFRLMGYLYLDKYCSESHALISWSDFIFYLPAFHFPALIMFAFKSYKHDFKQRENLAMLEHEKVATELKYLKAQLNPHFLFNTLNNLYSFVVTNSPKAASMVLQLSEILDYVLYRGRVQRVSLLEEQHVIENYIALQRIRFSRSLEIEFKSSVEGSTTSICPLILLSLVENAFKHGVAPTIREPKIHINLSEAEGVVHFSVCNSRQSNAGDANNDDKNDEDSGIGLSNIKRQLNLMYDRAHTIEIEETPEQFKVHLTLMAT